MKAKAIGKQTGFYFGQFYYLALIGWRLAIILLIFTLSRGLFYLFNRSVFTDIAGTEIASAFIYGIRFDISAILYVNIIFILLLLIPSPFRERKWYGFISSFVFYTFNGIALLFNIIDFEYFKFTKKRMTWDVVFMKDDLIPLVPKYLQDYWYLAMILLALILIAYYLFRKLFRQSPTGKINYFVQSIILIIFTGIFLIGVRGGIQLKPVKVMDAALYGSPQTTPLILNTPFTMLQSYGRKRLQEIKYMPDNEAEKLFPIYHRYHSDEPIDKLNIVIIIVESLSREFMSAYGAEKSYTPFLDSISKEAIVCQNSFANGTRSMEGIPAVLASIPNLMQDSYIYSRYQGNRINSIGSILAKEGYSTAFFHGGTNGTMGFDSFIKMAGFKNYYGRSEYNNEKDFDGLWGIYDEEFLQYAATELDKLSDPFCTSIFTLSSHQPVSVPSRYAGKFDVGSLPIHKGIKYADYSLRKFFETASKMKWFRNTLFVITGDHTPEESADPFYKNRVGIYAVPIIFYQPSIIKSEKIQTIVQHIDIMPSVLHLLKYSGEFISFGQNIFTSDYSGCSFNLMNGVYQIVDDNFIYEFTDDHQTGLYNYNNDLSLSKNEIKTRPDLALKFENKLKAIIQLFNNSMIHDGLSLETDK
ncbi:MAG: LTA synthase family protein [Ignavibacteriales bacterium]|nr:LTA synthase family protein [Ignavibacteriales bacterium]